MPNTFPLFVEFIGFNLVYHKPHMINDRLTTHERGAAMGRGWCCSSFTSN